MGAASPARDRHRLDDDVQRLGVIWRIQKRVIAWTIANAENGTPMPEQSARMLRMAFLASRTNLYLSLPLLFFMGAASHYPMFGR